MPIIRLPSEHDSSYAPARGPVFLLSCMDLRVMDEIVQFMDHDGLTNRYDHLTMAGAALGALGGHCERFAHWKQTFFEHLEVALKLHHVKDVYIIEHRDCGAYREFLGAEGDFDDEDADRELACHRKYAELLRTEIEHWAKERQAKLHVRSFLMDLRGRVAHLGATGLGGGAKPTRRRPKAR